MDLFAFAELRRDQGMGLAADAQDHVEPAWGETAFAVLELLAKRRPFIHVDDMLPLVSAPDHPNAFGAIWMKAIRRRIIEHSGQTRPSKDPKKHAHQYPIYRSLVYRS